MTKKIYTQKNRKFQKLNPGVNPALLSEFRCTQIAVLTGLNRNTVNRFLKALRERTAQYCESQSPLSGEVEGDKSFFGARRVK